MGRKNMSESEKEQIQLPDWFTPEKVDTIIVGFTDMYSRLMGKRLTWDFFQNTVMKSGFHFCNYLMTTDIPMNILTGFKVASWDKGFGDFHVKLDMKTLRLLPWHKGTAIVLGDTFRSDGSIVEEVPRRVLSKQIDRLTRNGQKAYLGSELEFFLLNETYHEAYGKNYHNLTPASDYAIDYHLLQPGCDEDVLRRIRNEMTAAGIPVECSKGETGKGQHEINLQYAEAIEMADRHVIYKMGVKDIATQQGKSITFMPKLFADDAGSGFHIHTSLWDAEGKVNLFFNEADNAPSEIFRQFLGGLLKYSRELTYFFAPTINSYKRYQPDLWAPTAIVCGGDNRTCGFRIVGSDSSLRVENRMPSSDANPYLAFAATIAAGLAGIEEKLDCGEIYQGNAYADKTLPRLPGSLEEAIELLEDSEIAHDAFGADVIEFYVQIASAETKAFRKAVTDWERKRYFEQT